MRRRSSLIPVALAGVAFALFASGCQTGTLGALAPVSVGDNPVDAAVVDVNGDGRPDLLVANAGSNDVSVRLAGPHGFFDEGYTMKLPKGAQPSAIIAGTFRAKGTPTVVVANRRDDSISVFDSFRAGASPTKTISLGKDSAPAALAVGDVDGDGDKDLLVTSRQPTFPGCEVKGCLLVFRDKGNGLAYSYSAYPVGTSQSVDYNPTSIAVGELWGGGREEIAVVRKGTDDAVVIETKRDAFEAAASYTKVDATSPNRVMIGRWKDRAALAVQTSSEVAGPVFTVAGPGKFSLDQTVNAPTPSVLGVVNDISVWGKVRTIKVKKGTVASVTAIVGGKIYSLDSELLKDDVTRVVIGQGAFVGIRPAHDEVAVGDPRAWWSSPTALDFGSVAVGSTARRTLKAQGSSEETPFPFPLRLTGPDADSFKVDGCADTKPTPNAVYVHDMCRTVTFAPTSPGTKHATIVVGRFSERAQRERFDEGKPNLYGGEATIALTGTAPGNPSSGGGGSALAVGTTDDFGKYADDAGVSFFSSMREVGMGVNRMDVLWHPGEVLPSASEIRFLERSIAQAQRSGVRVVLSVYSATAREQDPGTMCAFASFLAKRFPSVKDFVIGNEPNKADFWSPVDPAAYTRLLAQCYPQLHPLGVTVIGGALSARKVGSGMSPVEFIAGMGKTYRQLYDGRPIMDKLSFHPYPNPDTIGKGVQAGYEWPNAGIPNLDRVKQAVEDAFKGSAQPTFTGSLRLALDEVGWQAAILPQYAALYTGSENAVTVDEAAQAANDAALVSLVACDPLVSDLLFFHLVDEKGLTSGPTSGGWQSGLLRADLSRRPAFDATKAAIASGCTGATRAWTYESSVVGGSAKLTATQQQVRAKGKKQPGVKITIAASSDEGIAWKLAVTDTASGKTVLTKEGVRTARFDAANFVTPVLLGSGSYKATFTISATANPNRTVTATVQASSA